MSMSDKNLVPLVSFLTPPRSIETLGEAILNRLGQIDLPVTLKTSHYLFKIAYSEILLNIFMDYNR